MGSERLFGEATRLSLPYGPPYCGGAALLRGRNGRDARCPSAPPSWRRINWESRHLGGESGAGCAGEITVRNGVKERKMK